VVQHFPGWGQEGLSDSSGFWNIREVSGELTVFLTLHASHPQLRPVDSTRYSQRGREDRLGQQHQENQ
jgi:hypothetical protein